MTELAPLIAAFRRAYPNTTPTSAWRAPGRVNLIGEHTDYNLGYVLPIGIDLACTVLTGKSPDGLVRIYSDTLQQSTGWAARDSASLVPAGDWVDRAKGVACVLARSGITVPALHVYVHSEVPLGAGMSSSAAFSVALTLALGGPRDPMELAQLAQRSETEFAGVPVGLLDPFASAHARPGAALLLDCRSLEWRTVALPPRATFVCVNSMVRHDLKNSGYAQRVEECRRASAALGIASLRDADLAQVHQLPEPLRRRALHVVTENQRALDFTAAAETGDLARMGTLLTESHQSLRDHYEVSCLELDWLVTAASRIEGVYGSRMMGGGFGGSMLSLLDEKATQTFPKSITSAYFSHTEILAETYVCRAAEGAGKVTLPL